MLLRGRELWLGCRQGRAVLPELCLSRPVHNISYPSRRVQVRAVQGGPQPGQQRERLRLVDVIRVLPRYTRAYFRSPFRRALWGGICLLGGFYVAQTINLSFGALGVNDVIAAAVCVLFTEFVTRYYRTRKNPSFPSALLNNFKLGFTYGLFIDAFKLAS